MLKIYECVLPMLLPLSTYGVLATSVAYDH